MIGELKDDAKPAMVCTASDLLAWEGFPKGLRILLLEDDVNSASEMKSKLESMDYIVSMFLDGDEARAAVSANPGAFHLAIVEMTPGNRDERFKFLEIAQGLPTVMTTSNLHCITTMMKCISLGAVEFLQKPLSDEKVTNIWQHVVHKAFTSSGARKFEAADENPNLAEIKFVESTKNRKKAKVEWTKDLHKKFVEAVDRLGLEQAIPSRILELMNVEGLTRHNIASHLQKYRIHRRSILPKQGEPTQHFHYPQNPFVAYPAYNNPLYPTLWVPPAYPWPAYPAMHADAWGCPVMYSHSIKQTGYSVNSRCLLPNEVIDEVVREAMSKPWLPLPLGLKPPGTEVVLKELSLQGITAVPPRHRRGQ